MPDRTATRYDLRQSSLGTDTHAGLWFDRFVRSQSREDKEARRDHVAEVAKIAVPAAYTAFYANWQAALAEPQANGYASTTKYAEVTNRLAVGLGAESVLETSVALHHTYGVPYIPGSALKGLAAAYTRQFLHEEQWGTKSDAYKTLFGTTDQAGYVIFYDALFVSGTGAGEGGIPLMPDVITVHHQEYYQGKAAPAEWDSPNPVPFLTATGTYLLALAGPEAWVKHTFDLLEKALAEMGVGAKTSTGYGRMRFIEHPTRRATKPTAVRGNTESQQRQEPAPRRSAEPQLGDVYQGMITEINQRAAIVQLDGLDAQRFTGVFPQEQWEGKRYNLKNRARFEITATKPGRTKGTTVLELKRAAPLPKAGEA